MVFAARVPGEDLAGLPQLTVEGLRAADARALLDSALAGPLDARVRDRFVAETRGNPLALLELPRGVTPAELAGGFGLPGALPGAAPLAGRIEETFGRRIQALAPDSRRLLQLAAADPSGDASLVWRAAGKLGIPLQAATPAVEAGLAEFGAQVRFRHPLVRSAAYQSARWPRSPMRRPIQIAGPGTGPRPRPGQTRTSPRNSSGRPAGRRRAAGSPRRRHSWNARRR